MESNLPRWFRSEDHFLTFCVVFACRKESLDWGALTLASVKKKAQLTVAQSQVLASVNLDTKVSKGPQEKEMAWLWSWVRAIRPQLVLKPKFISIFVLQAPHATNHALRIVSAKAAFSSVNAKLVPSVTLSREFVIAQLCWAFTAGCVTKVRYWNTEIEYLSFIKIYN